MGKQHPAFYYSIWLKGRGWWTSAYSICADLL